MIASCVRTGSVGLVRNTDDVHGPVHIGSSVCQRDSSQIGLFWHCLAAGRRCNGDVFTWCAACDVDLGFQCALSCACNCVLAAIHVDDRGDSRDVTACVLSCNLEVFGCFQRRATKDGLGAFDYARINGELVLGRLRAFEKRGGAHGVCVKLGRLRAPRHDHAHRRDRDEGEAETLNLASHSLLLGLMDISHRGAFPNRDERFKGIEARKRLMQVQRGTLRIVREFFRKYGGQ